MTTKSNNIFQHSKNFYDSVVLNPSTLARTCTSLETWNELLAFHKELVTDEYVEYLDAYYRHCINSFGKNWVYLDIVNVLYGASKLIQPRNYLEIGVRRGRSVCTVAKASPHVDIFAMDMWQVNYAGMENPGPDFVQNELTKIGHQGKVHFINGNSHQTVPALFQSNPTLEFDMITVDGDHTEEGALQDLRAVVPHLAVGGAIVFDDIAHPSHPYLLSVWRNFMLENPNLRSFEYSELGYGVAFAIRIA